MENQGIEKIIENGNELLKKRKYSDALEIYEKAISMYLNSPEEVPKEEYLRALSNKGIVLYIQKKYDSSLECSLDYLLHDPSSDKTLLRCSKIYFIQRKFRLSCEYYVKISKEYKKNNAGCKDFGISLQKKKSFIELEDVLESMGKTFTSFIKTKLQLLTIIKGDDYDTFKLQDYFDGSTDEKYIECPPEKFYLKENDEKKSYHLHTLFSQGLIKVPGVLNVIFLSLFPKIKKRYNLIFFNKNLVDNLSLVRVRFMSDSIIYHSINQNGVIRRNYDLHYWIKFNFDNKEEMEIDLMKELYDKRKDYVEYIPGVNSYPVGVVTEDYKKRFKVLELFDGGSKKYNTFIPKILDEYKKKHLEVREVQIYNNFEVNAEDQLQIDKILVKKKFI